MKKFSFNLQKKIVALLGEINEDMQIKAASCGPLAAFSLPDMCVHGHSQDKFLIGQAV